jgi:uncharacterized protein (DUF2141 family)
MLYHLLFFAFALRAAPIAADSVKLTVIIENVQVGKGTVFVSVYNDAAQFTAKPVMHQELATNSARLSCTFDLPPGTYALACYQDLNGNKKLDAGMFNIPKEPYGFSNNYRPSFSAPKYADCVIRVPENTTSVITLK